MTNGDYVSIRIQDQRKWVLKLNCFFLEVYITIEPSPRLFGVLGWQYNNSGDPVSSMHKLLRSFS